LKPKIELKSWDKFQIPFPLATCEVRVGELMRVPREASEAERKILRQELEATMRGLSQET